jgi:hypothetical protein
MSDNINYFMGKDGFNWFIGVVEDRDDPKMASRVKVRCIGHHTADTQKIPTDDLPWASVMMPVTAGANSGIGFSPHFLVEGTWVVGFFRDPAQQEPVIMGALPGVNSTDTSDTTVAASSIMGGFSSPQKGGGFKDPNNKYPSTLYLTKPDTNLLGQESAATHLGHIARTISDSTTMWSTAASTSLKGSTWKPTGDKAKYPFNHVMETESGHVIEMDDTEGNERITVYHKTGTYVEIDPKGNMRLDCLKDFTQVIRGDMHTYVVGDQSLTVGGTSDWKSGGLVTELFAKGRKTTISASGDTISITGNVESAITGKLTESVTLNVTQDYTINLTTTIGALGSIKASGAMTVGGSSISFN